MPQINSIIEMDLELWAVARNTAGTTNSNSNDADIC